MLNYNPWKNETENNKRRLRTKKQDVPLPSLGYKERS